MLRPCGLSRLSALLAFAVVAVAGLAGCASTSGPRSVEIQRTTYGVAHIRAGDFESLAFGVAYAHAQDNVCQTADHLVTLRGERARYFGASATGRLGLRTLPNETIDLFIRAHMDDAKLVRAYGQMSREAQEWHAVMCWVTTGSLPIPAWTSCRPRAATRPGSSRW